VLFVSLPLAFVSHVSAQPQPMPGLKVFKSCPALAAPGSDFLCSFSVQNTDPAYSVADLYVTNTFPCTTSCSDGVTTAVSCNQGGSPVTTLGPNGSATDTCTGSVTETAPACTFTMSGVSDQISASGTDSGALVRSSFVALVPIPACTPVPTGTPANTPASVVVVPTLNKSGMLIFGLLIAAAGLLLVRKH
jgi:hypothetical protein